MIVVCPACLARFQYDESRFGETRSKRFKCPKCSHVFEVMNPAFVLAPTDEISVQRVSPPAAPEAAPAPPPRPSMTHTTAKRDRDSMLAAAGLHDPGLPAGQRFSLAFLSGPSASTVYVIEHPQVVIGRETGDVVTHDPETSRRHALVEVHGDGTVWLSDLQSTNGTFLDGVRITDPVRLSSQQEFTCGNSTFMLLVRSTDDFPLL